MKLGTPLNLVTLTLAITALVVVIAATTATPYVLPPLGLAIVFTVRRARRVSH